MTNGRNYYRMLNDRDLTLIASERFTTDLELVLLERLEDALDAEAQLEDAKREIDELNARLDRWMEQANTLAAQLEAK